MTYADPEKQREANRRSQAKRRGMTNVGEGYDKATDTGVSTHLERSWRSVAAMQASEPEKLKAIVLGVYEKGHGGVVRWGCSGPTLGQIAEVWYGGKPVEEEMGCMADEFLPEELEAHRKVRSRVNTLVIGRLPKAQQDELYRGLQASYGRRGE